LGVLSRKEKRDKKHCTADWEFCPEKKNETKSTAPLKDSCIYLYDIEVETDKKYKDLVLDEMVCVKKSKKEILKKAKIFYTRRIFVKIINTY